MTPDESAAIKQLAEKIQVLDLREGDVLVLSTPGIIPDIAYQNLIDGFNRILGVPHNKILILEQGLKMEIIRAEALKRLKLGGYQPQAQQGEPLPPPKEE